MDGNAAPPMSARAIRERRHQNPREPQQSNRPGPGGKLNMHATTGPSCRGQYRFPTARARGALSWSRHGPRTKPHVKFKIQSVSVQ
eukprot:8572283-Pyramimonas_sp.AAC.1